MNSTLMSRARVLASRSSKGLNVASARLVASTVSLPPRQVIIAFVMFRGQALTARLQPLKDAGRVWIVAFLRHSSRLGFRACLERKRRIV
jgi:hypothetical protein